MEGEFWMVTDKRSFAEFVKHAERMLDENQSITFKWSIGDQRTVRQNNAMWLWLDQLSEALNDAGYDMKRTLKPHIDIPWNKERAKEHLWDPIQEIMTKKDSSRRISKQEVNEIQEVVARYLAQNTGVSVPFPKRPEHY